MLLRLQLLSKTQGLCLRLEGVYFVACNAFAFRPILLQLAIFKLFGPQLLGQRLLLLHQLAVPHMGLIRVIAELLCGLICGLLVD